MLTPVLRSISVHVWNALSGSVLPFQVDLLFRCFDFPVLGCFEDVKI